MARKLARKLTAAEKANRRDAAKAERLNAKMRAEIPLFADQVPVVTQEDMFWKWRRNVAEAGQRCSEMIGRHICDGLQINRLRRHCLAVLGAEVFAKLEAYCIRTYPGGPGSSYYYGFWKRVLTGERIEAEWKHVEGWKHGQGPAMIASYVYQEIHMSAEAFYAEFPYTDPPAYDFPAADPLQLAAQ